MIRLIRGTVVARAKESLIIEVGAAGSAMGLKIFAPEPTLATHQPGSSLLLHTYLQVREDALTLFGFETEEELDLFELLLGVNGVGPKVALSILNTLSPDAMRLALANEEPAIIARAPGVGKRTAQKIVLDLKDKVKPVGGDLAALSQMTEIDSEVIEALIALGYSVVEAQRAVQQLPKDAVGVEERLRLALSQFNL
ncbi:MAG: Holliday junction branch migration protein RuvA [Caldilineaceae bacterium]|nr:Holliday junction branch migration protein RuvA [Caldilineaceae bacterium]